MSAYTAFDWLMAFAWGGAFVALTCWLGVEAWREYRESLA